MFSVLSFATRRIISLIQASDGKLYGMTSYGGSSGGVIFSFDHFLPLIQKLKDFDYTNGGAGVVFPNPGQLMIGEECACQEKNASHVFK